jgi:hypothetical protein
MKRIPFTLPDIGLREIRGEIYLTDSFLVLEIEDALLGEWDQDLKTIEIEPSALLEIRLERRLFKDRLALRPVARDLLEAVPGKHAREVVLEIWMKHRSAVVDLVDGVRGRIE